MAEPHAAVCGGSVRCLFLRHVEQKLDVKLSHRYPLYLPSVRSYNNNNNENNITVFICFYIHSLRGLTESPAVKSRSS